MTLNQHKIENYVIIASLKGETMSKLINSIPGSRLLITSLPGSAFRTLVESPGKPPDVLPGKLDIKRRKPGILYLLMVWCWMLVFDWAHRSQRLFGYNKHVSL